MQNKFKATTALLISAAGATLTLPSLSPLINLMSSFSLGLLNHGFIAATIGGLADWFAVTALFHKPLGISWRTEILKKNRKRIMNAIVDFVSNDLLSAKNIINNVKSENTADLLIAYFEKHDGRNKIKSLINEILFEIASTADTKSIAKSITPIVKSETQNVDAKQIIDAVVKILSKEDHSKKILSTLFEVIKRIFKSAAIQEAMSKKISMIRREYEGDSAGRAMVLTAIDLSDERILSIINENVDKRIDGTINTLNSDIVDPNAIMTAGNLCLYFKNFLENITNDDKTQKFFNEFKNVLANNFDLVGYIQKWLDNYLKGEAYLKNQQKLDQAKLDDTAHIIKLETVKPIWQDAINELVETKINDFIKSPIQQDKFDRFVKNLLEQVINKYHDAIPGMIHERLDALSDEELTTFVEDRVADDLQMIRINGSICGGVVGLLLYLFTYAIKFLTQS
ncbi:MAG: DUF445 domain-containing protein [Selenomonadaceae bacterium]|nr:DUF445 domain-containing protein [Selenomonadaceae bacterium]